MTRMAKERARDVLPSAQEARGNVAAQVSNHSSIRGFYLRVLKAGKF